MDISLLSVLGVEFGVGAVGRLVTCKIGKVCIEQYIIHGGWPALGNGQWVLGAGQGGLV